jgi:hypothetical protein
MNMTAIISRNIDIAGLAPKLGALSRAAKLHIPIFASSFEKYIERDFNEEGLPIPTQRKDH